MAESSGQCILEKLHRNHDCYPFDCNQTDLNSFLKKYALANQKRGFGTTYVACTSGELRVNGYVTISTNSQSPKSFPNGRGFPLYNIPTAHIGRLAVDKTWQGRGLGRNLLYFAFEKIVAGADLMGIHGIDVIAKDEKAKAFYEKRGFTALLDDPMHLFISLKVVRASFQS